MRVPRGRPFVARVTDDTILRAIDDFWRENYTSPSIRELAKMCGFRARSAMRYRLSRLAKAGKIIYRGECRRQGITPMWVVEAIDNELASWDAASDEALSNFESSEPSG